MQGKVSNKTLKIQTHQPRPKLMSLRVLNAKMYNEDEKPLGQTFTRLEKSLEKDNRRDKLPVDEPINVIPDFEEVEIENKLWNYFVAKSEEVSNKVEKEKVNIWGKMVQGLKKEVVKKIQSNRLNIAHLQGLLREKYKRIHEMFQEMKQEKLMKSQFQSKPKAKGKSLSSPPQNSQKMNALKESIEQMRSEVTILDQQQQKIETELVRIEKEWRCFLINFLREGYYLKEGVVWVLNELALIGYEVKFDDFWTGLDQNSRKCLMEKQKKKIRGTQKFFNDDKINSSNIILAKTESIDNQSKIGRSKIHSKAEMSELLKKNQLKDVYEGTKEYMVNWIKKSGWKEEILLPKIERRIEVRESIDNDWKQQEKRRINFAYDGEQMRRKVRSIMFGPRLQM